jgi:hypothetical protein
MCATSQERQASAVCLLKEKTTQQLLRIDYFDQ